MTQITKTKMFSQIVDQKEHKTTGTSLGGQLRVFSTSLTIITKTVLSVFREIFGFAADLCCFVAN